MKRLLILLVVLFCAGCASTKTDTAPVSSTPEPAFEQVMARAEGGHPFAQTQIGAAYYNGTAVAQDHAKALEWYAKAAEQGYLFAMIEAGKMHYVGEGTPQNTEIAKRHLEMAAMLYKNPDYMNQMVQAYQGLSYELDGSLLTAYHGLVNIYLKTDKYALTYFWMKTLLAQMEKMSNPANYPTGQNIWIPPEELAQARKQAQPILDELRTKNKPAYDNGEKLFSLYQTDNQKWQQLYDSLR